MQSLIFVTAAALLCACSPSNGLDYASPLDAALARTWSVVSFVSIVEGNEGNMVAYGQGQLVIAVSGHTAEITNVCPDYSGAVSATGSGDSATWSGTLACPATAIANCTSFTLTYVSCTAKLIDSVLNVVAAGTGTGCGVTEQVLTAFTSSNQ